jgi:hypothetical protein
MAEAAKVTAEAEAKKVEAEKKLAEQDQKTGAAGGGVVQNDVTLTQEMRWKLAAAFAVTVAILGAVLIFGKILVSQLYRNATETLRPAVAAMFHELTLFGVMGCFGYALLRTKALEVFNATFLGSPGTLVTTMMYDIGAVLLTALLFFFVFSVQLIVFGINIKNKWREWEQLALYTTEKSHRHRKTKAQDRLDQRAACCSCLGSHHDREDVAGYSYRLTRKGFISRGIGRHGALAQDFDFAAYLEVPLGETLTAAIAVSPASMFFLCLTVGLANVLMGLGWLVQICCFFGYGMIGVLFAFIVRLQLDRLRNNLYIKDPLVGGVTPHPTPQMLSEGITHDLGDGDDPKGRNTAWGTKKGKGQLAQVSHKQHWYLWGGEYGGAILHACYRVALLWATLYGAFYVLVVFAIAAKELHFGFAIGIGVLALPPPFMIMSLLGASIRDHAMFCSIEFMRRDEVIDQVISAARLRKSRTATRLVRAMYVVAEHKRLWALPNDESKYGGGGGGDAGTSIDLTDGIPHMKLPPRKFVSPLLLDMVSKGFAMVEPSGYYGGLGVPEVWHMLRWLGYDMTEFEVKYLCDGPPRARAGSPDEVEPRTVDEDNFLRILQKLITLHHSPQMLENVVTAAVREEALQHDEELQRDMAATGQAVPPISVNKLRKEWLDKPVKEDVVANLLLRYARDPDTVRAIRREYRLMMNHEMEAVDGAAEIKCAFTAGSLASLLKEQMQYLNSTARSKIGYPMGQRLAKLSR